MHRKNHVETFFFILPLYIFMIVYRRRKRYQNASENNLSALNHFNKDELSVFRFNVTVSFKWGDETKSKHWRLRVSHNTHHLKGVVCRRNTTAIYLCTFIPAGTSSVRMSTQIFLFSAFYVLRPSAWQTSEREFIMKSCELSTQRKTLSSRGEIQYSLTCTVQISWKVLRTSNSRCLCIHINIGSWLDLW